LTQINLGNGDGHNPHHMDDIGKDAQAQEPREPSLREERRQTIEQHIAELREIVRRLLKRLVN
jgi:hypothetical protein